jgi:hypothetical protein
VTKPHRIRGYITRLIEPVPGDGAPLIFMMPETGADLRELDGKHKRASGEIVVEGELAGRQVNASIELELSGEEDPLERTLRIVRG